MEIQGDVREIWLIQIGYHKEVSDNDFLFQTENTKFQ